MITAYNTYRKLLEKGSLQKSIVPRTVLKSQYYKNLIYGGILKEEKAGRGYRIIVADKTTFHNALQTKFPERLKSSSRISNVKAFRNSKATSATAPPLFLFRGFREVEINDHIVDMEDIIEKYKVFSASPTSVKASKICFIENLAAFFRGEEIFGEEYLFVHKYGRIGSDSVSVFEADDVQVFSDYDFTGIDEYLRIKATLPNANFYIPENYTELYEKYSVSLKGNKASMSKAVKATTAPKLINIRTQIVKENRFLEQEALFND